VEAVVTDGQARKVGEIAALFRYPIKSMRGEFLETANLGWHGIDGDRRMALHRTNDRGGFPWLSASRLPELILFVPVRRDAVASGSLPTHVRTPDGDELSVFSQEFSADISRRHGSPVEMMYLDRGIFDEAPVSVITAATVDEIATRAEQSSDVRRFRPNILIESLRPVAFEEDAWLGGVLSFGEDNQAPAIAVTNLDERCSMVNFDPESGRPAPEMLKVIVRDRNNKAGVYAAVTRRGALAVGQPVFFHSAAGTVDEG
jgi:uncharacterized protein